MKAYHNYDAENAVFTILADVDTRIQRWVPTSHLCPKFKDSFFIRLDGAVREARITHLIFVVEPHEETTPGVTRMPAVHKKAFVLTLEIAGEEKSINYYATEDTDIDFLYGSAEDAVCKPDSPKWAFVDNSTDELNEKVRNLLSYSFELVGSPEGDLLCRYRLENMKAKTEIVGVDFFAIESQYDCTFSLPAGSDGTYPSLSDMLLYAAPKTITF